MQEVPQPQPPAAPPAMTGQQVRRSGLGHFPHPMRGRQDHGAEGGGHRVVQALPPVGDAEVGGGSLYQTVRFGIDGTWSDSGNADATLAGQALNFDVGTDDLVRGFVGYDAVLAVSDGASLSLSAEAGYDSTDAVTLEAQGGLTFTF